MLFKFLHELFCHTALAKFCPCGDACFLDRFEFSFGVLEDLYALLLHQAHVLVVFSLRVVD